MVRDRRQTLSGIDAETMRPRVRFHGKGNRHAQKQKREEKLGNSENGNGKQRKSDKRVHNETCDFYADLSLTHERRPVRCFCRDSGNIAQRYFPHNKKR